MLSHPDSLPETASTEPASSQEPSTSTAPPAGVRRRWRGIARGLVIVIVGVGLGATIRDAWGELQADPGQWQLLQRLPWGWLLVAAACYAVGLLPPACYWYRVLRAFGQPVTWQRAMAAHLLGQLGKYVPGKAMVVVMRTAAIRGPGVQMPVAAVAVFVESLAMMASGATLSGVVIALQGEHPGVTGLAAVVALLVAVPTLPPLFRQLVRVIARRKVTASVGSIETAIRWRLFLAGWGWMLLTWTFLGASFAAIVHAVGGGPAGDRPGGLRGRRGRPAAGRRRDGVGHRGRFCLVVARWGGGA